MESKDPETEKCDKNTVGMDIGKSDLPAKRSIFHNFSLAKFGIGIDIEPVALIVFINRSLFRLILTDLLFFQACLNRTTLEKSFDLELKSESEFESQWEYCMINKTTDNEVAKAIASINIWKEALECAIRIFPILLLGAWSDLYGRKTPLIFAILGYILSYLSLIIICAGFPLASPETVAVVAILPLAVTGGSEAARILVISYIADTTSVSNRTMKIGIVSAFMHLGLSTGFGLGGLLKKAGCGYIPLFSIGLTLQTIALIYTAFRIENGEKEHVNSSPNTDQSCTIKTKKFKRMFALKNISDSAKSFFKRRENGVRKQLILLAVVMMCATASIAGEMSTLQQFSYKSLGWKTQDYGYFGAFRLLSSVIASLFALSILVKKFEMSDPIYGTIGCLSRIGGTLIWALFADRTWIMYLGATVTSMSNPIQTAGRAIVSKIVPRNEIGKINSLIGILATTLPLLTNLAYTTSFRVLFDSFPGGFFFISTALSIPPLFIFLFFYRSLALKSTKSAAAADEDSTVVPQKNQDQDEESGNWETQTETISIKTEMETEMDANVEMQTKPTETK